MIYLPRLLMAPDICALLDLAAEIESSSTRRIVCDATELVMADPVALCVLAATFDRVRRRGIRAEVQNVAPVLRARLTELDVLGDWLLPNEEISPDSMSEEIVHVRRLTMRSQIDPASNQISRAIEAELPDFDLDAEPDYRDGMRPHERSSSKLE